MKTENNFLHTSPISERIHLKGMCPLTRKKKGQANLIRQLKSRKQSPEVSAQSGHLRSQQ